MKAFIMKSVIFKIFFIISFAVFLGGASNIHAAGSIYLTPQNRTVYENTNFTVAVRMNTGGDSVNAASVNLSYPTDKLEYVGTGYSGGAFNIDASSSGGGGVVSISRGIIGAGVSGDRLIASVTFRPKLDSGNASIEVRNDSALVRGSDQANIASGNSGGAYTLAGASEAPSPTPTPVAFAISNVNVVELGYNTATIEWETDKESTSVVEFGLTENLGLIAESSSFNTKHSVRLDPTVLNPGSKYFYKVVGVDRKDGGVKSSIQSFMTKGITLVIEVTDDQKQVLADQEVTLVTPDGKLTATTDESGKARFENLTSITYTVIVGPSALGTASVVNIQAPNDEQLASGNPIEQTAFIQVSGIIKPVSNIFVLAGLVVMLLVIIAAIYYFYRRQKPTKPGSDLSEIIPTTPIK